MACSTPSPAVTLSRDTKDPAPERGDSTASTIGGGDLAAGHEDQDDTSDERKTGDGQDDRDHEPCEGPRQNSARVLLPNDGRVR